MTEASDQHKLVVAISSRALFDLSASHSVYQQEGVEAYAHYQIAQEEQPLAPGPAFALVKKLLALNDGLGDVPAQARVEVILLSRNSADTGLRVFNSIHHHNLAITRAAFTSGDNPWRYVQPFGAHLFLSTEALDVVHALQAGVAAATIMSSTALDSGREQLRIAFDGDAVLFSDEAEQIFQKDGLTAFQAAEQAAAATPLRAGPFKSVLMAVHRLQREFPADACPLRTALVTARAAPAHERVIRTLRSWNIRIDEMLFLGGMKKVEFLRAFAADMFFDDQQGHIDKAKDVVAAGHVPHGVVNQIHADAQARSN